MIMPSEPPDIQAELDILLGAIARELGCDTESVPLELEVVTRRALLAVFNKGFRRHKRVSETLPLVLEERSELPTERPPPSSEGNAGVYMYVDPTRKGKSK